MGFAPLLSLINPQTIEKRTEDAEQEAEPEDGRENLMFLSTRDQYSTLAPPAEVTSVAHVRRQKKPVPCIAASTTSRLPSQIGISEGSLGGLLNNMIDKSGVDDHLQESGRCSITPGDSGDSCAKRA